MRTGAFLGSGISLLSFFKREFRNREANTTGNDRKRRNHDERTNQPYQGA